MRWTYHCVTDQARGAQRLGWLNRELLLELVRKKRLYDLEKEDQTSQADHRALIHMRRV